MTSVLRKRGSRTRWIRRSVWAGSAAVLGHSLFPASVTVPERVLPVLPTGASTSQEAAAPPSDTALARATFDSVWSRIATTHYDPEMGGVDWEEVRRELRPRALEATSSEELRSVLREMLGRLGESHFVLLTADVAETLGGEGGRGEGDPGLDVRWVEGGVTVVRVRGDGPAAEAGVAPGWILERVGLQVMDSLVAGLRSSLAARGDDQREALVALHAPMAALSLLRGPPGHTLELAFRDGSDRLRTLAVDLVPPPEPPVRFGNLPPFQLEVDSGILPLEDGRRAGLIRFTGWFPPIVEPLARTVDRFRELDGVVLDLRGNPGGLGALVMRIGGHFLDEDVDLGEMRTRDTTLRFVVNPQRVGPDGRRVRPFAGPVAILVDPLSASTSEIFAGGMQAIGRARVFGETTAGQALPALVVTLPNGDRLMHAIADLTAPDGTRLEGRGVIPDVRAAHTRGSLLRGEDPALEAALRWIQDTAPPSTTPTHPELRP
jgi:carboxyl-terminal processing protease